jgi:hypothetical protein
MAKHKYGVGETVVFRPMRMSFGPPSVACTVVRHLPSDGTDLQYRVKAIAEGQERVVRESELKAT